MKILKYLVLGFALVTVMPSCHDLLDEKAKDFDSR